MSLFICTPCYGGMVHEPHFVSCLNLKEEFERINMDHEWFTLRNESLITRGRDVCAASYLRETEYKHLLFIDSDIEFSPADVAHLWNLCDLGADVAVGAYRKKQPGATLSAWLDGGQLVDIDDRKVPFEVEYAGTGFMLIKRHVFERLIEKHPDWEYEEGHVGTCWAFFQDPVEDSPQGRFKMSEDYFFCRRVRELGMRIVLDPKIELKHHGQAAY